MKNIGIWLYRYMAIHANRLRHLVWTVLDTTTPSPGYRPALQRVRTPVSPSVNDIRLRSDVLRGYPETNQPCHASIKQHSCGNGRQDLHMG
jgi:hypothetical protein